MKVFVYAHGLLTAVFATIIALEFDLRSAGFFLCGSLLSLANIGVLYFALKAILSKKSVASAMMAIVLKYGISAYLLYKIAELGFGPLAWTAGGLAVFLVSALAMASLTSSTKSSSVTVPREKAFKGNET